MLISWARFLVPSSRFLSSWILFVWLFPTQHSPSSPLSGHTSFWVNFCFWRPSRKANIFLRVLIQVFPKWLPSRYVPREKQTRRENVKNFRRKQQRARRTEWPRLLCPQSPPAVGRLRGHTSVYSGDCGRAAPLWPTWSIESRSESPGLNTKTFCFIFATLWSVLYTAAKELLEKCQSLLTFIIIIH